MKRSRHPGIDALAIIGLTDTVMSIRAASQPIPHLPSGDNGKAGMRARLRKLIWCVGFFCAWSGVAGATDQVVSTCTEAVFKTAFTAVNTGSGGTITFSCPSIATIPLTGVAPANYYVDNGVTMVIDGGNKITFDGANTYAFFQIYGGGNLTLKNLTLTRGQSNATHPIESLGGGITLDHVTASNNNAKTSVLYSMGTTFITNSSFSHNSIVNAVNSIDYAGAAVRNDGGTLTISLSTFDHNTIKTSGTTITFPGNGGAISNESNGLLYINSSTFTANSAFDGGAIRGDSTSAGKMHIKTSTFASNTAVYGGAIENFGNELKLDNDQFNTNSASNIGGALWSEGGLAFLNGSEFIGNTAANTGGAIHCDGNNIYVNTSTFSGNTSNVPNVSFVNHGGAIYTACYTVITNSTFYNNSALGSEGGAIYFSGSMFAGMYHATIVANQAAEGAAISSNNTSGISPNLGPQLSSSIFSGNTHGHSCSGGPYKSVGYSLADDQDCGILDDATDNPNVALPMGAFVNNGGPTRTLLPPAIATNTIPLAQCSFNTDQRGALRKPTPPGGKCDSGAVEVGGVIDEIFADAFELP
ncbi:MAG: choice-of-anchor Q domain-containing protein [Dokdonella sp.]